MLRMMRVNYLVTWMYRCINFAKGRIIFDCEDLCINLGNRLLLNFIPSLRTNFDTSVDKKKDIIWCWWQKTFQLNIVKRPLHSCLEDYENGYQYHAMCMIHIRRMGWFFSQYKMYGSREWYNSSWLWL